MDDVQNDQRSYEPEHPQPWGPPQPYPPRGWGPPPGWVPARTGAGLGIASMVTGIASLVFCLWGPLSFVLSGPPGVVAVVLGVVTLVRAHRRGTAGRGQAVAGVVCGGVAVVVTLLWVLVYAGLIIWGITSGPGDPSVGAGPPA